MKGGAGRGALPQPALLDRRDERQIAEDFFRSVCEWSCEVRGEILVYHDGYFRRAAAQTNEVRT